MNNLKNYRHEYKYLISYVDFIVLQSKLKAFLTLDDHVNENGVYLIRSLYFDNPYNKCLKEKLDGDNFHEKFRIRIYNNDYSYIRLEKKVKYDGLCNKETESISKDEVERLLQGDYEWLYNSEKPLFRDLYIKISTQLLRPRLLVDYTRVPLVYEKGNVRISFDYNICTGLYNNNLFEKDAITVLTGDEIILEVKYDEYLPDFIKKILGNRNCVNSFSKYAICHMYD